MFNFYSKYNPIKYVHQTKHTNDKNHANYINYTNQLKQNIINNINDFSSKLVEQNKSKQMLITNYDHLFRNNDIDYLSSNKVANIQNLPVSLLFLLSFTSSMSVLFYYIYKK
jgi:hypothetical protein